jgi:nucleotide-binding universal stress UspA family protein
LVAVVEKVRSHYILRHDQQRTHLTFEEVKSLMTHLLWKVGIAELRQDNTEVLKIGSHVGVGDPATEILRLSHELLVDLIAVGCREHEGASNAEYGGPFRRL